MIVWNEMKFGTLCLPPDEEKREVGCDGDEEVTPTSSNVSSSRENQRTCNNWEKCIPDQLCKHHNKKEDDHDEDHDASHQHMTPLLFLADYTEISVWSNLQFNGHKGSRSHHWSYVRRWGGKEEKVNLFLSLLLGGSSLVTHRASSLHERQIDIYSLWSLCLLMWAELRSPFRNRI